MRQHQHPDSNCEGERLAMLSDCRNRGTADGLEVKINESWCRVKALYWPKSGPPIRVSIYAQTNAPTDDRVFCAEMGCNTLKTNPTSV